MILKNKKNKISEKVLISVKFRNMKKKNYKFGKSSYKNKIPESCNKDRINVLN